MIKLITSAALLLFVFTFSSAQDLLIKNNGDTLKISVVEINDKYLIYNNLDIVSLKVFTTHRHKLNRIIYSTGEVFIFSEEKTTIRNIVDESEKLYIGSGFFGPSINRNGYKLNDKQVVKLYRDVDELEAERLLRKGRAQNTWGNILGLPFGYLLG